jgi:GMP synthase-like glutamine amidotransferase
VRILCLQHVPWEGPGSVRTWARSRGHELTRALSSEAALPKVSEFEWLVLMGGPMGTRDEALHPWLRQEKELLRAALDAGRKVLGICLGSQLLAEALGSEVRRNPEPEVGWFPVKRVAEAETTPIGRVLPVEFTPFHWHSDTFTPPPGAVHLAASEACAQQAFAMDARLVGLQFHLEVSGDTTQEWLRHMGADLVERRFVQRPEQLLWEPGRFERGNRLLDTILDALAAAP